MSVRNDRIGIGAKTIDEGAIITPWDAKPSDPHRLTVVIDVLTAAQALRARYNFNKPIGRKDNPTVLAGNPTSPYQPPKEQSQPIATEATSIGKKLVQKAKVTIFRNKDDIKNIEHGLYKYVLIEKDNGSYELRISSESEGFHYDMTKPGDKVVGAGRCKFENNQFEYDGSSTTYATSQNEINGFFTRGIEAAKESGLEKVGKVVKEQFSMTPQLKCFVKQCNFSL